VMMNVVTGGPKLFIMTRLVIQYSYVSYLVRIRPVLTDLS